MHGQRSVATRAAVAVLLAVAAGGTASAPAAEPGPKRETWSLDMATDVRSVTHGGALGIGLAPSGMRALDGAAAANLALTTTLRDRDGRVVGIAAELEEFPAGDKIPDRPWKTWWLLLLNGRGTLFVEELEAVSPAHRPAFDTAASGREWRGRLAGATTVGPRADGRGRIVGGTGEFAGARGAVEEYAILTRMTPDGTLEGRIELRVEFDPTDAPPVAVATPHQSAR